MSRVAPRPARGPSSSSTSQAKAEMWFVETYGRAGVPPDRMMGEWRIAVARHHRWPREQSDAASWAATMNDHVVALQELVGGMRTHAEPRWRAREPQAVPHLKVFARAPAAKPASSDGARSRFLRQVAAHARFDDFVAAADRFVAAWSASALSGVGAASRVRGQRIASDEARVDAALVIAWVRHAAGDVRPALAALAAIALEVDEPCERPEDFAVRRESWKRRCKGARDHGAA